MRNIPMAFMLMAGLMLASGARGDLITNGDFEAGNTGFSSEYAFGSIGTGATIYSIVADPSTAHGQATSYGDHTTGAGFMMAVNGCCEPAVLPIPIVWSQSVAVDPNTDYLFSMFVSSWFPALPAVLEVSTAELGSIGTVTAPSAAGLWQGFQAVFNSGSNSVLTLQIVDTFVLTSGAGNDFALDDINLVKVPEPATIDIKPGSDPNSINLTSRGKIPVAVLTTETFDAIQIDPLTVEFGPEGATESHGRSHVKDIDEDGDMDLVLHFNTQETGIQCGDTEGTLTGETFDDQAITGTDSINTVNCD